MCNRRQIIWLQLENEELLGLSHGLMELEQEETRRNRTRRRWWTRDWLLRKAVHGQYSALLQELQLEDPESFKRFLRVDIATFQVLLAMVEGRLTRTTTRWRQPLSPGLKLALTLRFLATGEHFRSLEYSFRVAHNTISSFVVSVCRALVQSLEDKVINTPTERQEWLEMASRFQHRWQFPHALGALDGKHIAVRKPHHSGSTYYNYKGFYSIVLMALVDADYKFRWIQVGDVGSSSDGQIWNHCELRQAVDDAIMGIPEADPLPQDNVDTPYYFIGDDAFALRTYLMKPFSRRDLTHDELVFNYRLSRARRVVENAFGILANRFRCLLTTLQIAIDGVPDVVKACVVLHNFLKDRNPACDVHVVDQEDVNHNVVPGSWREQANLFDMDRRECGNRDTVAAKRQRLYLKHYLCSPAGSVQWQDAHLRQF